MAKAGTGKGNAGNRPPKAKKGPFTKAYDYADAFLESVYELVAAFFDLHSWHSKTRSGVRTSTRNVAGLHVKQIARHSESASRRSRTVSAS